MKRLSFLVLVLCATLNLTAQNRSKISLHIIQKQDNKALPGAVIEIAAKEGERSTLYFTSGTEGYVEMTLHKGDYSATISFLGYTDYTFDFSADQNKYLGKIALSESAVQIDSVVKQVEQFRTTQNADTLIYNAAAFKTTNDADVEGLLTKMPGITITDGSVEVQGENIKKVFVDGEEFFGDDVNIAIKTLPAEAVERVEVFDKLSDEAEFSGVDDGQSYKAINLVTKKRMRNGKFGQAYAGIGYQPDRSDVSFNPKYMVGGNINFFNNKRRTSVIGLFNNINRQNFSFEDLLGVNNEGGRRNQSASKQFMVKPQTGVALVNAIGVNFSDKWGKKEQVKIQTSYFFNNTDVENKSLTNTWYESPAPLGYRHTIAHSDKINNNHRFNARIDWRISRRQSFQSRTGVSYQGHRPQTSTIGYTNADSEFEAADDDAYSSLSYIDNKTNNIMRGANINQSFQYRLRLGKPGRIVTVSLRGTYRNNNTLTRKSSNNATSIWFGSPLYNQIYDQYFGTEELSWEQMHNNILLYQPLYQYINTPTYTYNINSRVQYNEPIARNSLLTLQYRITYNSQHKNQQAWYTGDEFSISDDSAIANPNITMHNIGENIQQRVGPGFRYSKNKNTFVANVFYENIRLKADINSATQSTKIDRQFHNFQYFAMVRYAFNSSNSIRAQIRSNTDIPDIVQLQDIFDISSPQHLSIGNTKLKPENSHNFSIRYIHSNMEKGRTFMAMFSAAYHNSAIVSATLYNPKGWSIPELFNGVTVPKDSNGESFRPTNITSYENLDGLWAIQANLSYGMPLSAIKCNLNFSAGVRYNVSPTAIYNRSATEQQFLDNISSHKYTVNNASNIGYNVGITLSSNISEKIDFTVAWRGSYNQASNSASQQSDQTNNYLRHSASGSLKWIFGRGFTLTTNLNYTQYYGIDNHYNEEYFLCNLYLGKKIFKSQLGEVQIGVNDLTNSRQAFARRTGSGYTRNTYNSVVGRYFMVQFVYNLRKMGKNGPSKHTPFEGSYKDQNQQFNRMRR